MDSPRIARAIVNGKQDEQDVLERLSKVLR